MATRSTPERIKKFAYYYLKSFNSTQAAISAGYEKHSASARGCQLKKHPIVQEIIEKFETDCLFRVGLEEEKVGKHLAACIFSDIREFITKTKDGKYEPKDILALPDEVALAVKELKLEGGRVSIKFFDKLEAMDMYYRLTSKYPQPAPAQVILPILVMGDKGNGKNGEARMIFPDGKHDSRALPP